MGSRAGRRFETYKPALIVLDLMLPDTTGEALLERLKTNAATTQIFRSWC